MNMKAVSALDLPEDLFGEIITTWLSIRDVCQLDSAICNKHQRKGFLHVVASKGSLFLKEDDYCAEDTLDGIVRPALRTKNLNAEVLMWIAKRGIHIHTFSLGMYPTPSILHGISKAVMAVGSTSCLERTCQLYLNNCDIRDVDISPLLIIMQTTLKAMEIRRCPQITADILPFVAACSNLEYFYWDESECSVYEYLGREQNIAKQLKNFNIKLTPTDVPTEQILEILANFPALEGLRLPRSQTFHDEDMKALNDMCPSISHLELPFVQGYSFDGLIEVSKRGLLQYLDICGTAITDSSLFALSEHCPLLRYIDIDGCQGITDVGIMKLAECLPLEELYLWDTPVTDQSIMKISEASNCSNLAALSVMGCEHVTLGALVTLLEKRQSIKKCFVSDTMIHPLRSQFPNVSFDLSDDIHAYYSHDGFPYGFPFDADGDDDDDDDDDDGDGDGFEGDDDGADAYVQYMLEHG